MRKCMKCLFARADKGCLLKQDKLLILVCRTCYALHSDNSKIVKKFYKNNIGLLRNDGKEWFEPRDNANETITVLITKR